MPYDQSRRRALHAIVGASLASLFPRALVRADQSVPELSGDGVRNDLPAIQRLLAAAEIRGRGTVRLPAGRFRVDPGDKQTALTLPANVNLEGAGRDRTILLMAEGAQGHVINAPFGWVRIADLTIDGNAGQRAGKVGHNLRFEGDNLVVERVRLLNSASYGIGIAQRRYAKDVTIVDVEIVNAGDDGIDLKNSLQQTERITIKRVVVRGFGRPDSFLPATQVGTRQDSRRGKAAIDLRGRECRIEDLRIVGIRRGRDGLRFRHGEAGDPAGPGAHGGMASRVTIEGDGEGQGIAVIARDVRLTDINVRSTRNLLRLAADNATIKGGKLQFASGAAVVVRKTPFSRPAHVAFESVLFRSPREIVLDDIDGARFENCDFQECGSPLGSGLLRNPRVLLQNCRFERSCNS